MAKALDVAKYLIQLAEREAEPEMLTPMRLQKLLYYVQGWSLGLRQTEMFGEAIEAWQHGPVVPEVYRAFSAYQNNPIAGFADDPCRSLTAGDREFIESIWAGYRKYSASGLRDMTHHETPWLESWSRNTSGGRDGIEISQFAMRQFFATRCRNDLVPMFDLERLAAAEREFFEGGGIDLAAFAESVRE